MASVAGSGTGDFPEWWAERNKEQAASLLKAVIRGRGRTIQPPSLTHASGDHPRPQGPLVHLLFQPFVWPQDSETHLNSDGEKWLDDANAFDQSGDDVRQAANGVLDGGSWEGKGADAAHAAYSKAAAIKYHQADITRKAGNLFQRAATDVGNTKKHMFAENKQAHQEVEEFPQAGGRATNVRRRDGAGQHPRVGETSSDDAGTDVQTAPAA